MFCVGGPRRRVSSSESSFLIRSKARERITGGGLLKKTLLLRGIQSSKIMERGGDMMRVKEVSAREYLNEQVDELRGKLRLIECSGPHYDRGGDMNLLEKSQDRRGWRKFIS